MINARVPFSGFVHITSVDGSSIRSVKAKLGPQYASKNAPAVNGYGYKVSYSYSIPNSLASGVYFWNDQVPFIVRSIAAKDVVVVVDTNTINAYSCSGGNSLYDRICGDNISAGVVSFMRPLDFKSSLIYPFLKWMKIHETEIGSVSYIADSDLDEYERIRSAKLLVIAGHSEYWSRQARINFDKFVSAGGNAAVFSGNNMWWPVRYGKDNTLICYKTLTDPEANPLNKTNLYWVSGALGLPTILSVGAEYQRGGMVDSKKSFGGYKALATKSAFYNGIDIKDGDLIPFDVGTKSMTGKDYNGLPEFDGTVVSGTSVDGSPIINNDILKFYRIASFGYNKTLWGGKDTYTIILAMQRNINSGIVFNAATNYWGSQLVNGKTSNLTFSKLTLNIIQFLKSNSVFDSIFK